jgi:hypothetical protein
LSQAVLQSGGFLMIKHLLHRRLAHVHDGQSLQVSWEDFLGIPLPCLKFAVETHLCPPPALQQR